VGTSRAISRILYRPTARAVTTIHLATPLPTPSCGLPGSSGGQPSNASCLALLRVGFTEPHRSPGTLVVSYTTVSPLPPGPKVRRRSFLCGTVPRVTPGGCYPPPCPVESGLSSAGPKARRGRLPDSSVREPRGSQPPIANRTVPVARSALVRVTLTRAPSSACPSARPITAGSASCTSSPW
jgi:hypothetical protein